MPPEEFPESSRELLEFLDKSHPHRCIGLNEDPIKAHRYAAQRELIDTLLNWKESSDAENPRL